ncbi:MAG: SM-20-related protein [Acidimicrobiales bacterium]|jgi:SM-20-related protein
MTPVGRFGPIVNDLSLYGYSVSEGLLTPEHIAALAAVALTHQKEGRLVRARTGKAKTESESVRGDSIAWLDEHSVEAPVLDCNATFDALRRTLNEQLFMNLHDVESHFAIYPPGAVYQKHLDQFATGHQSRQLSLVLYLNEGWISTNGGELRLYLDGSEGGQIDISPIAARLVLFESSRFWHEVLPSNRERLSLTGWFRTR